jgi:virginiamycin B lyase
MSSSVRSGSSHPLARTGVACRPTRARRAALALATLVVATLALAARADAYIYWANAGANTIGRANLEGDPSSVNQSFIEAARGNSIGVAVDANSVYWTAASFRFAAIGRAGIGGDPSSVNQSFVEPGTFPNGVAVDDSADIIYWVDSEPGAISRASVDDPSQPERGFIMDPPGTNSPMVDSPMGVAVDDSAGIVYWANRNNQTIARASVAAPNAMQNFISLPAPGFGLFPVGLALDGTYIYWTNLLTNSIGRASLSGDPNSVNQSFITGANSPRGVAVFDNYIYWSNAGTNTIGRAELPAAPDGNPSNVEQSFIQLPSGSSPTGVAVDGLSASCTGTTATIVGTSGSDTLRGTNGSDVIAAGAGDDTVTGLGGADLICATPGADVIRGKGGADVIRAGSGDDRVRGGGGDDALHGKGGEDTLRGGGGDDLHHGGGGEDDCRGGGGSDSEQGC